MKPTSIVIIIQVLFVVVLLSLPLQSRTSSAIRTVSKHVLGASIIADDTITDTPTPDTTSTNTPTDTPSTPTDTPSTPTDTPSTPTDTPSTPTDTPSTPTDTPTQNQSQITPTPLQGSSDTSQNSSDQSTQTTAPDSTDQSLLENTTGTEIQQITPTEIQQITPTEEITLSPSPTGNVDQVNTNSGNSTDLQSTSQSTSSSDTSTNNTTDAIITDPQSVITDNTSLNDAVINNVANQTVMVDKATTPEQKVSDLQTFVKENVIDLNSQLVQKNFSSTALISQQINNQLDAISNNLKHLPSQNEEQTITNVKNLCKKADTAFRTEAMVVPEDLEQDIIINEAKCYNLAQ